MSDKFNDIVNNESDQADKDLAVSTAKENFFKELEDSKDEKALANEIKEAETLVTDENSVFDPLSTDLNYVNSIKDIKVEPVKKEEVVITKVEEPKLIKQEVKTAKVKTPKPPKAPKQIKIKKATNWNRGLYFVAPLLSAVAVAGALTPIAIIKPIKALDPVITIDDDSSEGISIKSNNVRLNKDSTITLATEDEERIISVDLYINNNQVDKDQYSFNQMTNVVSINASAVISTNIKLKVITDAPRYEVSLDQDTNGISDVKFSSKHPKFRKELVLECTVRNGYILSQKEIGEHGLQIHVGDRILTSDEVVVDATKNTITIKQGIVNGDVKLSGGITTFIAKMEKGEQPKKDDEEAITSVHVPVNASYKYIDDIHDVVILNDKINVIKPKAQIVVDANGRDIKLVEDNDYTIKSNWNTSDNKYHYDLIFTNNGRNKIIGPVTATLTATIAGIDWDNSTTIEDNKIVALGLESNPDLHISAKTNDEQQTDVKDIRIIGDDHGYKYDNDKQRLVVYDRSKLTTGSIKLQAFYDNAKSDIIELNVVKPKLNISGGATQVRVGESQSGYTTDIYPAYIKDLVSSSDVKWTSDDENILSVTKEGDTVTVTGNKRGKTNINAIVTLTRDEYVFECKGSLHIDTTRYTFNESSWDFIAKVALEFELSKQDEAAQRKLCDSFEDTEYIPDSLIDESISDPDRKIEAHLGNFIGKEKSVSMVFEPTVGTGQALPYRLRIIGINHDTILDKDYQGNPGPLNGKKALFTLESIDLLSNADKGLVSVPYDSTYTGPEYYDQNQSLNYKFPVSKFYKSLNTTSNDANWYRLSYSKSALSDHESVYTKLSNYFTDQGLSESPIKKVIKKVGVSKDNAGEYSKPTKYTDFVVEDYDAYCFPLTTAEMGVDQSKINPIISPTAASGAGETIKGKPGAVKDEGFAYQYYSDVSTPQIRISKFTRKDRSGANKSIKMVGPKFNSIKNENDHHLISWQFYVRNDDVGLYNQFAAHWDGYGIEFCFCI